MKLYLSGPITGVKDYKVHFAIAECRLNMMGYDTINPAELTRVMPSGATYEDYMNICMELLALADAVVLLPGWEKSTGANREMGYALGTDKIVLKYRELVKS